MIKMFILVAATLTLYTTYSQEVPTPKALLEKVKEAVASVKTLSYESEYRNFNSGLDDSLSVFKAKVWLKTVPADTIFGAHLHVAFDDGIGKSDYYYDGINAIDIWHQHKKKELDKQIKVIQPRLLGNGVNRVQSRVSVLPYFNELINTKALEKWLSRDSIVVQEDPSKKYWVLQWPENSITQNFFATRQIFIDKESNLITAMHRKSTWNGTRMSSELFIKNIEVNKEGDDDRVSLKQSYPGYVTSYDMDATAPKAENEVILTGQKAGAFSFASFGGGPVSLTAPKGKLLLLDFWETWCGYCYLAMPRLKDLHQKYGAQGLEIVGIVTENRKGVQQVIDAQKFPYPTVYADEKLLQHYAVEGRPTYVVIDDTGTIVEHSVGSLDKVEKYIEKKLGMK